VECSPTDSPAYPHLRTDSEVAKKRGDDSVDDSHIVEAQNLVQRGRLRNQIRDQIQHAHLLLETLASLEERGSTPARPKTIKTRYERAADSHAVDPLTTLKSIQNTLSELHISGSSNAPTGIAARGAAGTTSTASISTPRSSSRLETRSKRNATADTRPRRQTKRGLSLSSPPYAIQLGSPRNTSIQRYESRVHARASCSNANVTRIEHSTPWGVRHSSRKTSKPTGKALIHHNSTFRSLLVGPVTVPI